jgi:hypothetical protein
MLIALKIVTFLRREGATLHVALKMTRIGTVPKQQHSESCKSTSNL